MNVLLSVLLVAVAPEVPIEARYPEADAVFHCDFDDSCDENFDKWPDRWERPQGPRYPRYVSVKISEPQFEGQTKGKLGNIEAKAAVESVVADGLGLYFEEHPDDAARHLLRVDRSMRGERQNHHQRNGERDATAHQQADK